jgi:hypothetical protein
MFELDLLYAYGIDAAIERLQTGSELVTGLVLSALSPAKTWTGYCDFSCFTL